MTTIRTLTAMLLAGGLATGVGSAAYAAAGDKAMKSSAGSCPDSFAALQDSRSGEISNEEARQVRLKIYDALDENNDNLVSRDEYVKCLSQAPIVSNTDLRKAQGGEDHMGLLDKSGSRFGEIDTDDNGRISWQEYMKAARDRYEKSSAQSKQSAMSAAHLAGWTFAKIDADVSGDITTTEWGANLEESADASKDALDRSFKSLDANGDGKLSRKEYQAASDKQFGGNDSASKSGSASKAPQSASLPVWDYQIWVIE